MKIIFEKLRNNNWNILILALMFLKVFKFMILLDIQNLINVHII